MLRPAYGSVPGVAGEFTQVARTLYETYRYAGVTIGPASRRACSPSRPAWLFRSAFNALSFIVAAAMMVRDPVDAAPADHAAMVRDGHRIHDGLATAFGTPAIAVVVGSLGRSILAGGLLDVSEPILATAHSAIAPATTPCSSGSTAPA